MARNLKLVELRKEKELALQERRKANGVDLRNAIAKRDTNRDALAKKQKELQELRSQKSLDYEGEIAKNKLQVEVYQLGLQVYEADQEVVRLRDAISMPSRLESWVSSKGGAESEAQLGPLNIELAQCRARLEQQVAQHKRLNEQHQKVSAVYQDIAQAVLKGNYSIAMPDLDVEGWAKNKKIYDELCGGLQQAEQLVAAERPGENRVQIALSQTQEMITAHLAKMLNQLQPVLARGKQNLRILQTQIEEDQFKVRFAEEMQAAIQEDLRLAGEADQATAQTPSKAIMSTTSPSLSSDAVILSELGSEKVALAVNQRLKKPVETSQKETSDYKSPNENRVGTAFKAALGMIGFTVWLMAFISIFYITAFGVSGMATTFVLAGLILPGAIFVGNPPAILISTAALLIMAGLSFGFGTGAALAASTPVLIPALITCAAITGALLVTTLVFKALQVVDERKAAMGDTLATSKTSQVLDSQKTQDLDVGAISVPKYAGIIAEGPKAKEELTPFEINEPDRSAPAVEVAQSTSPASAA